MNIRPGLPMDKAAFAGPQTPRYPDIVVDRAGGDAKDHTATAPVLLAEVMSPSTAEIDLGDKAVAHLRLPSLLAYMVLSRDEPKAWQWSRTTAPFAPGPQVMIGIEATVRIAGLQPDLSLADVYAGIETK